jgi:Septum formation
VRSRRSGAGPVTTGLLSLALAAASLLAVTAPAEAGVGGKPTVGQCRTITAAEAAARTNTTRPSGCTKAHDDRVIAVPDLPAGVSWTDLSDKQILKQGIKACTPVLRTVLGQDDKVRDRSAYDFVFFQPTAKQIAAGARWLRCDLVLRHGKTLADLPTDKTPALSGLPLNNHVARCLKGPSHITTTCSSKHSYRATGSFTVPSRSFPGRTALVDAGRAKCPSRVHSRSYLFTWKPKPIWNLVHDRTVVCFTKTSG